MLAYGAAKAAVHQLTKGLGASDSGLPSGAKAVCIMPYVLSGRIPYWHSSYSSGFPVAFRCY
jgi:NAD(P)-dependent dehydrogenase (short-subunit alcohol dehydrogenase family)